jgi:hypothetical protein
MQKYSTHKSSLSHFFNFASRVIGRIKQTNQNTKGPLKMRNIELQQFYSKDLREGIEAFNLQTEQLNTERGQLEADLAHLKTEALSGSVEALTTLTKRRDNLKTKLLTNMINTVKLAEDRSTLQEPVDQAHKEERAKLQDAQSKRMEEISFVFEKYTLPMRQLQAVTLEACQPYRAQLLSFQNVPKVENDSDRLETATLRRKIADMMG